MTNGELGNRRRDRAGCRQATLTRLASDTDVLQPDRGADRAAGLIFYPPSVIRIRLNQRHSRLFDLSQLFQVEPFDPLLKLFGILAR
jgi:hypothetical protein